MFATGWGANKGTAMGMGGRELLFEYEEGTDRITLRMEA